jgi:preprotein translocase subunit SecG
LEVRFLKTFLSIVQIIICILLMAVVLLQPRKQGRGGIFGGATMADPTASQWARFSTLSKITVVVCTIFMVNSLVLILL